uniref:Uncharacterized protein n=1 Tax=Chelydra serpentina TaxID=8475 RepID=A0A8C3T2W2_CHESE
MSLVSGLLGRVLWLSGLRSGYHARGSPAMEQDRALEVYDIIRTIRDPEKPNTLEELAVVTESCVEVHEIGEDEYLVLIRFTPTVPRLGFFLFLFFFLRKRFLFFAYDKHFTENSKSLFWVERYYWPQ